MAKVKSKSKGKLTATAHPIPVTTADDFVGPPHWVARADWLLRVLILIGGVAQIYFGLWANGIMTLIALTLIVSPGFFTRGRIKGFPLEIELILFVIVLVQFILGAGEYGFYATIPYADKIIHFAFPAFIGLIGFTVIYTLYYTGKLDASNATMALIIILVALGIGAFWEILEYSSDRWLYPAIEGWHHFQGSIAQSAIEDTMTDLIMDFLGGMLGALLGVWLVNRAKKKQRPRLYTFLDEVTATLSGQKIPAMAKSKG